MPKVDHNEFKKYYVSPPNADDMYTEFRPIETLKNGDAIFYTRMKVPMMSDRDNVSLIHFEEPDGGVYISTSTIHRDDVPEVKGVVRMFA